MTPPSLSSTSTTAGSHTANASALGSTALSTTRTTTILQTVPPQAVLHLRGARLGDDSARHTIETEEEAGNEGEEQGRARRRIAWAEDVVDNEGLGRKKSKVCCIYHAPRAMDESSDESDSSSSSSSDSDSESNSCPNDGSARQSHAGRRPCTGNSHHSHDHNHTSSAMGKAKGKAKSIKGKGSSMKSPNAYERQPKPRTRNQGTGLRDMNV